MLLEVVVFDYQSAWHVTKTDADRIELCSGFGEGGTTPSQVAFSLLRAQYFKPIVVMIRPRGGDFVYSKEEKELMIEEIKVFKNLGCDEVLLGALTADGDIDEDFIKEAIEVAYPVTVAFHRAIDRTKDIIHSVNTLIEVGCNRILTSGGKPTAIEGVSTIAAIKEFSKDKIIITAGGKINSQHIDTILNANPDEIHIPAITSIPSIMSNSNDAMNEVLYNNTIDLDEVKLIRETINNFVNNKGK